MHLGAGEGSNRTPLLAGLQGHARLSHLLKLINMASPSALRGVTLEARDPTGVDSVFHQEMLCGTHLPCEAASLHQLGESETHGGLALREVLEIGRQCR